MYIYTENECLCSIERYKVTMDTSITAEILEKNYALAIGESFTTFDIDPDVISQLLINTRSAGIRRAYSLDLRDFFAFSIGKQPDRALVLEFLHLEHRHAIAVVLKFKA